MRIVAAILCSFILIVVTAACGSSSSKSSTQSTAAAAAATGTSPTTSQSTESSTTATTKHAAKHPKTSHAHHPAKTTTHTSSTSTTHTSSTPTTSSTPAHTTSTHSSPPAKPKPKPAAPKPKPKPAAPKPAPLPGPVVSGSSGGAHVSLHGENHAPAAGKLWEYMVLATDASGKALKGTVETEFAFNGTVVGRQNPATLPLKNGRLDYKVTFPARSIGIPLDLRVVVRTSAGTVTLNWPVKSHH